MTILYIVSWLINLQCFNDVQSLKLIEFSCIYIYFMQKTEMESQSWNQNLKVIKILTLRLTLYRAESM